MTELIDRLRIYAVIQWEILRTDCRDLMRYDEGSFSHGLVSGQVNEDRRIIADIQSTFPDLDKDTAPDVHVETLSEYASRQRDALRKNKGNFNGLAEGSYDHAFTCGMIKRGEQAIINLYVTCPELGDVDGARELLE
ncbi:MAG: hypothetical protein HY512_02840 [Candidatus Aenigmarchaeota archaeon]|nr:hypothetical protein [Candidatus Aenigmarchaeota archaeon]